MIAEHRRLALAIETQLLHAIAGAISTAPDFETALELTLRQICEERHWACGEVWLWDDRDACLRRSPIGYAQTSDLEDFCQVSRDYTFAPKIGLPGRVWSFQQAEWHYDVSQQSSTVFPRAQLAREWGLKTGLGVPILAGDRAIAVLALFRFEAGDRDPQEIALFDTIAAQLGNLWQCRQTEVALRESQRRLATLIDSLPGIAFACGNDSEWSMTYLSEGCFYLTGYHSEELIGQGQATTYNNITHPDDLPRVLECIRLALERDETYVVEYRIRTKDGREKWLWEKGACIFDRDGQFQGIEGFITDITERKHAEDELRQAEQKYRSIFENAVEGIFQTSPEGHYVTVNPMLAKIYGYDSPEELIDSICDIEHQLYVRPSRRFQFKRLLEEQDAVWAFESQVYRKDGSIIWISENARAIRDETGQLLGYEGTVEDITRRKQAEAEIHKRDLLLQGVADAMNHLLVDSDRHMGTVEALRTLGIAARVDRVYICENHPHPETGEPSTSMRFEWTREGVEPTINQPQWQNQGYHSTGVSRWYETLATGSTVAGITRELPACERPILEGDDILSILMVPIVVDNKFWGYIGFDDCHCERRWSKSEESILIAIAASIGGALQRHRTEEAIRHHAFHDLLTGLPNRMLFDNRLFLTLKNARDRNSKLAVMFLDLDRFKIINDTLGHAIGDGLLKQVAQRLTECLREEDTIARWGGDEFILLLPNIGCREDVVKIAQRILDSLRPTFAIDTHKLHISCSLGIAVYPEQGEDAETLLKHADAALYLAKDSGRSNYQFYSPAMGAQASELLLLENHLHQALDRGEFIIYYQPQVQAKTAEITGMEALTYWRHSELGLVSPQMFIDLAEDTGSIVPIGDWVLREACTRNKAWQDAGLPHRCVAVNLSPRQFREPDLVQKVAQILEETGLEAKYLELEITEETAMDNLEFTRGVLMQLRDLGVRISMDDFGVGYASLNYLKQLPLNTIKIDLSFIRDLMVNPVDMAIVRAIVELGRGLDLTVVAEGVETLEQWKALRDLGCQMIQGYSISAPLLPDEATKLLSRVRLEQRLKSA
jgi:diguanylate cyclase (GGDEF)-like protein/PAS domain S-box-containing protein